MVSLDDVAALTKDSDFTPFMAREVGPEVRNAAMKKLFADPHFNVMDGLDTYIDDYSIADPIPQAMLRQMIGAKFLNLFNEDDSPEVLDGHRAADGQAGESAHSMAHLRVAQSDAPGGATPTKPLRPTPGLPDTGDHQHNHADTHLRLQPDDAPGPPGTGIGAP